MQRFNLGLLKSPHWYKNKESLIHLENNSKLHENLEQTKKAKNNIFNEKEDWSKLTDDTIKRENDNENKINIRKKTTRVIRGKKMKRRAKATQIIAQRKN